MSFKRQLYQVLFWRGLYVLSAFGLNLLFARYYGASASSTVYYLINLYSFLLLIASLSLEMGMSYFLSNGEADAGALSSLAWFWTILLLPISLLLLQGYFYFFDSDIPPGLFWLTASTYIPGQLLITFFTALFYAKESSVIPNGILMTVNGALALLLGVAIAVPSFADPVTCLRFYFFGTLAQGVLLAIAFRVKFPPLRKMVNKEYFPGKELLKKIFRLSLAALLANILYFLVYRVDYWFVKRFCTAGELGNYIQVSKLGQLFLVIPGILSTVIFPRTARYKGEGMPERLGRIIRFAVIIFVIVFLFLLFTGRWLFPLLLGASYDRMYLPTLILLPGILFFAIATPVGAYFSGLHRPDISTKSSLAGLLIIIAGDFVFIPSYKLVGAAAVSTVGYFVCMSYALWQLGRTHRVRLSSILILTKEDWRWAKEQLRNVRQK
jgi:O-antigen/teichoic acid export membrane protein